MTTDKKIETIQNSFYHQWVLANQHEYPDNDYIFMDQHYLDILFAQFLFDYKNEENIYRAEPISNEYDLMAHVKLFNPYGAGTWYLHSMDEEGICFGAAELGYEMEYGSIDLVEIMRLKPLMGIGRIEQDIYTEPKRINDIMKEHNKHKENYYAKSFEKFESADYPS